MEQVCALSENFSSPSENKALSSITTLNSKDMFKFFGKAAYAEHKHTRDTQPNINLTVLETLPNLTSLELNTCCLFNVYFPPLPLKKLVLNNVFFDKTAFASLLNLTEIEEFSVNLIYSNVKFILSGDTRCEEASYVWETRFPKNEHLLILAEWPNLHTLDLSWWFNNSNETIEYISKLSNLTSLNLSSRTKISNFASLSKLTKLTSLTLRKTLCDHNYNLMRDETLVTLGKLTTLTHLDLSHCSITTILPLQDMTNLTSLIVDDCDFLRGINVTCLIRFNNLTYLSMNNTFINCNNLTTFLRDKSQLTTLNLGNISLGDEHLEMLANLTNLSRLDISASTSYYGDLGLSFLVKLINLNILLLDHNLNITNSGIAYLTSLQQLTQLGVYGCDRLNLCLNCLKTKIPSLKEVHIRSIDCINQS